MDFPNITADIDFLCGSTSATYSLADKTRNVNIAYNDVARLIWESAGGWQYDDSNSTTLPIAKTTMVHSQQDYSIPSTILRVQRVEVKDANGNWRKLDPIDVTDTAIAMPEFQETPGMPIYYDMIGSSLMLYPPPASGSCTLASGLAIYVDRGVTELTTASTATPGFATPFHRILSYAAALDFVQDNTQREFLMAQKARMEQGLIRFYSKRAPEIKTRIKPATAKRWKNYK